MKIFNLFKKKEKLIVPVGPGKISRETMFESMKLFFGDYAFLDPEIPSQILNALERFAMIIPDLSQNVKNIVNLGNSGHTLEVVAATEGIVEQAEDRLNALARDIFPYGGTDGLVNKMLWDIAVFGSPSIEAVIRADLQGVKKVVVVPHSEIRFKYDKEEEQYLPYQKAGNAYDDYLELNPLTYYYAPLFQRRNSPYAIPPMLAALSPLVNQLFMNENIRYVVKKIGLLGLIHAVLSTPTRKPKETDEQYLARLKTYLNNVATDLTKNYRDGVMITYDEVSLKHFAITGDIRGVNDLYQLNEEQFAPGMDTDPAMLGRTYSTTETYAGVIFAMLLKKIQNAQRITGRGMEKIYLLDLYLGGIPVEDVNLDFDPGTQLKPQQDAEVQKIKSNRIVDEYFATIITRDEAREELGYPPLETLEGGGESFKARFKFEKGRYTYQRDRIRLSKGSVSLDSEEEIEGVRVDYVEQYLSRIKKIDDATRKKIIRELRSLAERGELPEDPKAFAEKVYKIIEAKYPDVAHSEGLMQAIRQNIKTIYTFYRATDDSLWGDAPPVRVSTGVADRRAQDFLSRIDDIFFSEYVQNKPFKEKLKTFLRDEVMEQGFEATEAVLNKFQKQWKDMSEHQVRRIVNTSLTRVRSFAHIRKMKEAGIKELEVVEVMDRITCGRCREVDGRIVKVALADEIVEEAINLPAEEFKERYITGVASEKELMTSTMKDLVSHGKGIPPIHPECRGRIKAVRKKGLYQFEEERGEKLPDIERQGVGDYSEYGKKVTYTFNERKTPKEKEGIRKTTQTLVYSTVNKFGQKIYLTKEGIAHTINAHPKNGEDRRTAIGISATVVGDPNQIYLDKDKGSDTKVYIRVVRGHEYAVVTKRVGPEVIWTAFRYDGLPAPGWEEKYDYRKK